MSDISDEEVGDIAEAVLTASAQFDQLCQDRHDEGEEKYGSLTWMGNDVVRMMIEELADTTNYCRYQAIKLMLMQQVLEVELSDKLNLSEEEQQITIGIQAFKGVKDVGWQKK